MIVHSFPFGILGMKCIADDPSQEWIGSCSPLLTEVDTNKILLVKFREEGKKLRRSSVVEKPEHSSRPAAQLEEPRRCW